jgi:acetyl esterase
LTTATVVVDVPAEGGSSLGADLPECDQELRRYLAEQASLRQGRPTHEMTPEEAREAYAQISTWQLGHLTAKREVGQLVDEVVVLDGDEVRFRIYAPPRRGTAPTVVYLHGGGFVFGTLDSYDETARMVCAESEVVVVNVGYLLAPEHRYPAPLMSCVAVVRWVKEHVATFGGDPDAVVVMGDSAGGNLAAATALASIDLGLELAGQVVLYAPLVHVDHVAETGVTGWADRDQRFGPTLESMSWYWRHYVADARQGREPLASPLLASDLASAPPAFIGVGALDTLRVECATYGRRLADSGVDVVVEEYPGLTHGYITHGWLPAGRGSTLAREAARRACAGVRALARAAGTARRAGRDR